jgi:cytochrome c553
MDGLLMKKLTTHSLTASFAMGAIALACTLAGIARAADISLPPDPGARSATTLASWACSKCHGASANGISISPLFPILAGQNPIYISDQLKLLRQHYRADPHARAFMWGISNKLTDEQIQGLAEYFSALPAVSGKPSSNPALAEKGKDIYLNGVKEPKVVKCAQCHGEVGAGTNNVPRLAGQHKGYLALQLHYYHTKLRENKLMNRNVANITDDQIDAVVEYISTLSGTESKDTTSAGDDDTSSP